MVKINTNHTAIFLKGTKFFFSEYKRAFYFCMGDPTQYDQKLRPSALVK